MKKPFSLQNMTLDLDSQGMTRIGGPGSTLKVKGDEEVAKVESAV